MSKSFETTFLINKLLNDAINSISEIKSPENKVEAISKIIPLIPEDFSLAVVNTDIKPKTENISQTQVPKEMLETVKNTVEEVKSKEIHEEKVAQESVVEDDFTAFMKKYGSSTVSEVLSCKDGIHLKDNFRVVQEFAKTVLVKNFGENSEKLNPTEFKKVLNQLAKNYYNIDDFMGITVDKFVNDFVPCVETLNMMTALKKSQFELVLKEIGGESNFFVNKGLNAISPTTYKPIRKSYEELKAKNLI